MQIPVALILSWIARTWTFGQRWVMWKRVCSMAPTAMLERWSHLIVRGLGVASPLISTTGRPIAAYAGRGKRMDRGWPSYQSSERQGWHEIPGSCNSALNSMCIIMFKGNCVFAHTKGKTCLLRTYFLKEINKPGMVGNAYSSNYSGDWGGKKAWAHKCETHLGNSKNSSKKTKKKV
jgi:hypothetical protein